MHNRPRGAIQGSRCLPGKSKPGRAFLGSNSIVSDRLRMRVYFDVCSPRGLAPVSRAKETAGTPIALSHKLDEYGTVEECSEPS